MIVAPMKWWDLPTVHAIETDVYPSSAWSLSVFWSELALVPRSREYFIVRSAADPQSIEGYAGLAVTGRQADVQTLAVAKSRQRRGLGQQLLSHLLARARARQSTEVLLDVGGTNTPAIDLYMKNGFVEINRRKGCYRGYDETIVMRKLVF